MTTCQPLQHYFTSLLVELDTPDSNGDNCGRETFPCTIVSDDARGLPRYASKSAQRSDEAMPPMPPSLSRWDNNTTTTMISTSSTTTGINRPSLPKRQVSIELTSFQDDNDKSKACTRLTNNNINSKNQVLNDDSSSSDNTIDHVYHSDSSENNDEGIDICLSSRRWSSEVPPQATLKRPERSPIFAKTESWSSLTSLSSSSSEVVATSTAATVAPSRCTWIETKDIRWATESTTELA